MKLTINQSLEQGENEIIINCNVIDNKTFLYCKDQVYESKQRLVALEEKLKTTSFIRISKNCILNCTQLKSVSPLWNHRMEATLLSGEKLVITRNYISSLKEKLEMGRIEHV